MTDAAPDTWTVGTNNVYFQTWVPFTSETLSTGLDAALSASAYAAKYGLLSPYVGQPMGSFLHLGATDPEMADPTTITDDTQKQATYTRALNLAGQANQFTDDFRQRGDAATPPAARQAESQLLHTKGGWRDHTDGNRVSTTAGDKVEVIGGNSVLVILGRPTKDNSLNASDWSTKNGTDGNPLPVNNHVIESSGWLGYENDGGPGHIEEIRWIDGLYGAGTWMVREKTYAGDAVSIGSGANRESFVGSTVELNSGPVVSYQGRLRDIPDELISNAVFNPTDIYRDEQVSAQASLFPYMSDMGLDATPPRATPETFIASVTKNAAATYHDANTPTTLNEQAQTVLEYERVDSKTSDSIVTGDVNETSVINGGQTTNTTIGGTAKETTTVDTVNNSTTVKSTSSETETVANNKSSVTAVGGAIEEVTVWGATNIGVEAGISQIGLKAVAATADFQFGFEKLDFFYGLASQEINICPNAYEFGGDKLEFSAAGVIAAATVLNIASLVVNIQGVVNLGAPPVIVAALAAQLAEAVAKAAAKAAAAAATP
jgi:hypothetical protein